MLVSEVERSIIRILVLPLLFLLGFVGDPIGPGLSKVFGIQKNITLLLLSWIGQQPSVCRGVLIPGDRGFFGFMGPFPVVRTGISASCQGVP